MPTLNLKNITIKKLEDRNFDPYFLIVDNNTDKAFFCFKETVKSGWTELANNYHNIKEVELEFKERETNFKIYRKVVSLYSPQIV